MKLVIGIDPGTGASSPTGLAIFNVETRTIVMSRDINTSEVTPQGKLRDLSSQMEQFFLYTQKLKIEPILVASETFLMLNKRVSDVLQRLIGSYMSRIPDGFHFQTVHNTTVKRLVAGTGSGDKMETALGTLYYFNNVPQSRDHILDLIQKEAWDRLDAFAIGIAALKSNNPMYKDDDAQDRADFIKEGLEVFHHEPKRKKAAPKAPKAKTSKRKRKSTP